MTVLTNNEPLDMRPKYARGNLWENSVTNQIITPARRAANLVMFGGQESGNADEQAGTYTEIAHPNA